MKKMVIALFLVLLIIAALTVNALTMKKYDRPYAATYGRRGCQYEKAGL